MTHLGTASLGYVLRSSSRSGGGTPHGSGLHLVAELSRFRRPWYVRTRRSFIGAVSKAMDSSADDTSGDRCTHRSFPSSGWTGVTTVEAWSVEPSNKHP